MPKRAKEQRWTVVRLLGGDDGVAGLLHRANACICPRSLGQKILAFDCTWSTYAYSRLSSKQCIHSIKMLKRLFVVNASYAHPR